MPEGATVANSSCLIALGSIGRLGIIEELYSRVTVPAAVADECQEKLPDWVDVRQTHNRPLVRSLSVDLEAGEAEVIALAMELAAARVILDDKKARRIARELALPVTGTLALLARAKQRGVIANVREVVNDLLVRGFRVSRAVLDETIRLAGE